MKNTSTNDQVNIPIICLTEEVFSNWRKQSTSCTQNWLDSCGIKPKSGDAILLPNEKGTLSQVLWIVSTDTGLWDMAALVQQLPSKNAYTLESLPGVLSAHDATIGIELAKYAFLKLKTNKEKSAQSFPEIKIKGAKDMGAAHAIASAIAWGRDLINLPASHLGPAELAQEAASLGKAHNAKVVILKGEELLDKNYPAIFAVGKGSPRPPHFIDISWGNSKHPKLVLVGKGVCFDSGGLDLKPSSGMILMKKDMGGAAHALTLARIIMTENWPLNLRILIGSVENAISGHAMRPSDVVHTRKGLNIEIGNTDAEGRVVLADLLFEADQSKPDLIVDFATLTGAARVALGPEVPVCFTNKKELIPQLLEEGEKERDPLWPLPLWKGYRKSIDSKVADINNNSSMPYAGAITAALFLEEFISAHTPWIHLDLMAWNISSRPGRPEGGEIMGVRTMLSFLKRHFRLN